MLHAPAKKVDLEQTMDDKIERKTATFTTPHSNRFILDPKEQSHQYFNVYQNRIRQLRPALVEHVKSLQEKNSSKVSVEERVLDIRMGVRSYIIGTIFKEMPLKPNVLREYTQEQAILLVPEKKNFVSEKDVLILEDETGRIKLIIDSAEMVSDNLTGTVVAACGEQVEGGAFKVESIIRPGWPTQVPRSVATSEEKFVILTSGLDIGTPTFNPLLSALMSDFICGELGGKEQNSVSSRIARVLLCGNTFCSEEEVPASSKLRDHTKSFSALDQARLEIILKESDAFVYGLAASVPVDVIPGPKDPSNYSIPQQPLNKCLFPRASQLSTCNLSVTNPYLATIDGVEFLGHCGQPTKNIMNYTTLKTGQTVLDVLLSTLEWRHLAPTAPDTLSSYPFKVHDPFIIETCPHVYFVSDQDKFETRRVVGTQGQVVQLISVPSFVKTKTFVLLNLQTLDCHPVTVGTWDD